MRRKRSKKPDKKEDALSFILFFNSEYYRTRTASTARNHRMGIFLFWRWCCSKFNYSNITLNAYPRPDTKRIGNFIYIFNDKFYPTSNNEHLSQGSSEYSLIISSKKAFFRTVTVTICLIFSEY